MRRNIQYDVNPKLFAHFFRTKQGQSCMQSFSCLTVDQTQHIHISPADVANERVVPYNS